MVLAARRNVRSTLVTKIFFTLLFQTRKVFAYYTSSFDELPLLSMACPISEGRPGRGAVLWTILSPCQPSLNACLKQRISAKIGELLSGHYTDERRLTLPLAYLDYARQYSSAAPDH